MNSFNIVKGILNVKSYHSSLHLGNNYAFTNIYRGRWYIVGQKNSKLHSDYVLLHI